jgi:hypothetical protein
MFLYVVDVWSFDDDGYFDAGSFLMLYLSRRGLTGTATPFSQCF